MSGGMGPGPGFGTFVSAPNVVFTDDFSRADTTSGILGNDWIVEAGNWRIGGNQVVCSTSAMSFFDQYCLRPVSENIDDISASMELVVPATPVLAYPLVFVRGSVSNDAYLVSIAGSGRQAKIGRKDGVSALANLVVTDMSVDVVGGDRYRLSITVTGKTTVAIEATVEHWNGTLWDLIWRETYNDSSADRKLSGQSGFSIQNTTSQWHYDNFHYESVV